MELNRTQQLDVVQLYNSGSSTYDIAKKYGTYPGKIRKLLVSLGAKIRSRSEAQSTYLAKGEKHPTRGKKLSKETKDKIGSTRAKEWASMDPEDKQKFRENQAKNWESMSESTKDRIQSLAAKAVRRTAETGSKAEMFVRDGLRKEGIAVDYHVKNLLPNDKIEMDMVLPGLKLCIELDGPSHFRPIWGEERLQKHIRSDAIKSGLVLNAGYAIIRVRMIDKNYSNKKMQDLLSIIKTEVNKIREAFPPVGSRYIEIEVSDGQVRRI